MATTTRLPMSRRAVAAASVTAMALVGLPALSAPGAGLLPLAAANPLEVCDDPTMWASKSNGDIVEYTASGVPTGNVIDMVPASGGLGFDIAIESDGEIMWSVSGGDDLDAYRVSDGAHLQKFELDMPVRGSSNSLSFTGETLLVGTSNSSKIFSVDNLPVPVAGGPTTTLSVSDYLDAGDLAPFGWAGDFVTLADGSVLGFATNTAILGVSSGGTRLIKFQKNVDGSYAAPVRQGEARTPTDGKMTSYGGTFVNGSLYYAQQSGKFWRMDEIPTGSDPDRHWTTVDIGMSDQGTFYGATSVQESNAICSSPDIKVSKSAGTVSGPDAQGNHTASYTVTVENTGGAPGTYAALTDTPVFDPSIEVKGATWTGSTSGNATGEGPFLMDNRNVNLGAGETNTYEISVRFSYAEGVYTNASECAATPTVGRGLTNIADVSGDSAITDSNADCLAAPDAPDSPVVEDPDASIYDPSYQIAQTQPSVPVTSPQTGDTTVPTGTEYALGTTLPEGWTVDIDAATGDVTATPPADAANGTLVQIPVIVTYPDSTVDNTNAAFRVLVDAPVSDSYDPAYTLVTTGPGEPVDSPQTGDDLPGGVTYSLDGEAPEGWTATIDPDTGVLTATPPADAANGTLVQIPVIVTYEDGSTDNTNAAIRVLAEAPVSDSYDPAYDTVTTGPGEPVDSPQTGDDLPEDVTYSLGDEAPEGWTVEIDPVTGTVTATPPADAENGDLGSFPVNVTYEDGSTDETTAIVRVLTEGGGTGSLPGGGLGSITGSLGGNGDGGTGSLGSLGGVLGSVGSGNAGSLAMAGLGSLAIGGGIVWGIQNGAIVVPPHIAALLPEPLLGLLGIDRDGNRVGAAHEAAPPVAGPTDDGLGRG